MFFVQMETGLMEIVQSLNRSWIDDNYFSLYKPIHHGGHVQGEMSGRNSQIPLFSYL